MNWTRREFAGLLASTMASAGCASLAGDAQAPFLFGACRPLKDAPLMKEVGFDFIEQGVQGLLVPEKSDADYAAQELKESKQCVLPIRSCNGFLPAKWRLTGPESGLQWEPALEFADVAFRRADELGIKYIVLGSSRARKAPEGFPRERALDQFVEFSKRLADLLERGKRRVKVVLEPLSPRECNIFNTVSQGYDLVDRVGSEHVQLLADLYHMGSSSEPPSTFERAHGRILHCHIATRVSRQAPGLESEDLSSHLRALAATGYRGGVSIEGGWGKGDFKETLARALATLRAWS